eukprot:PhM_4_TR4454/c0_g1_i1/m.44487
MDVSLLSSSSTSVWLPTHASAIVGVVTADNIFGAASRGDAPALVALASSNNTKENVNQTILDIALVACLVQHRLECATALLRSGANIDNVVFGETALSLLCNVGPAGVHRDLMSARDAAYCVYYLLLHGASASDPHALLLAACSSRNVHVTQVLLEAHCSKKSTSARAITKSVAIDINCVVGGVSAMMLACHPAPGSARLVDVLLRYGAHVNQCVTRDENGANAFSPLHIAVLSGDITLVEFLLSRDADANQCFPDDSTARGVTPLMLASSRGDTKMIRALLSSGASLNYTIHTTVDPYLNGATAVMCAFVRRHHSVVRFLLTRGASLTPTRAGARHLASDISPFAVAVISGHTETVSNMLANSAFHPALHARYTRHGTVDNINGVGAVELALVHNRIIVAEMLFRVGLAVAGVCIPTSCWPVASATGRVAFLEYLCSLGAVRPDLRGVDTAALATWLAEYGSDDDEDDAGSMLDVTVPDLPPSLIRTSSASAATTAAPVVAAPPKPCRAVGVNTDVMSPPVQVERAVNTAPPRGHVTTGIQHPEHGTLRALSSGSQTDDVVLVRPRLASPEFNSSPPHFQVPSQHQHQAPRHQQQPVQVSSASHSRAPSSAGGSRAPTPQPQPQPQTKQPMHHQHHHHQQQMAYQHPQQQTSSRSTSLGSVAPAIDSIHMAQQQRQQHASSASGGAARRSPMHFHQEAVNLPPSSSSVSPAPSQGPPVFGAQQQQQWQSQRNNGALQQQQQPGRARPGAIAPFKVEEDPTPFVFGKKQ